MSTTEREALGVVERTGDTCTLTFERRLHATAEEVWRALTEPAELAAWLADASVDLRVGGELELRFDDGTMHGTITELHPPTAFAYRWHEGDRGESHVRFELSSSGDATTLTLVHTRLAPESTPGFGAGWHHHLELLAAAVRGAPIDWSWERFEELKASYDANDA